MKSAVLLLVFNRPDTTKRVFEAIRNARPKRLYIAADGPRINNTTDPSRCQEVKNIICNVDWPCEVFKLFRDHNLGTKYGIAEAIDWFFQHEEEGIILEDDILPLPSFFQFCDEMLEYHRDNLMVGMVSGDNFISPYYKDEESYFFSKYTFTWGWATWRRVWQQFDISMKKWPTWKLTNEFKALSDGNIYFHPHWISSFDMVYQKKLNTCWDYQWTFTHWSNGLLSILPKNNLIENIGFGNDATHTFGDAPNYLRKATPKDMLFPIIHPKTIDRNIVYDQLIDKVIIHLTFKESILNKLRNSFLGPFLRQVKHKVFKR